MKALATLCLLIWLPAIPASWAHEPDPALSEPVTIEGYYKIKWGQFDRFMALYKQNHLPILEAMKAEGLVNSIRMDQPVTHGSGEAGWDLRVTIVFADPIVAYWQTDLPKAKELVGALFEDQAAHRAAEQQRMGLVDSHWDVMSYRSYPE